MPRPSAAPVDVPCGTLPAGTTLDDYHRPPARIHARSAELLYWRGFSDADLLSQPPAASDGAPIHLQNSWEWDVSAEDALNAALSQELFFKAADDRHVASRVQEHEPELSDVDLHDAVPAGHPSSSGNAKRNPVVWGQTTLEAPQLAAASDEIDNDAKLQLVVDRSLTSFNERRPRATYVKSPSVVLEAACHLLREKALNIPDVGGINVKQARALLWNAVWLQEHLNQQWREDEPDAANARSACEASLANEFALAIMGPGGTGKTAVLKVVEAMTIFFTGADTVRKMAPSNAAARLLGGDTLHASCKLPYGKATLTSRKGQLSGPALRQLRARWRTAVAAYLDEVSMVSADQLHQCDVRLRTAKNGRPFSFGGMAVNLCGDFLQLPPVDKSGSRKSLAVTMDEYGCSKEPRAAADEEHDIELNARQKEQNLFESRRGHDLWRSVHRVVCLTVNIRAPGPLSRLLAGMRSGHIPDELWSLYEQRVMRPDDDRLRKEPFSSSQPVVIVHRHKIRAMRSLEAAKRYCREHKEPLFMVQARDDVVHDADRPSFTSAVRDEMLKFVNPEQTRGLSSFLPLHVGMKLVLSSKECVRLSLVKGCVCTLRSIVFADREDLPYDQEPGVPHMLRYMPAALVLQADGADWTLAGSDLPKKLAKLPKRKRLGLFQLSATTEYLRVKSGEKYIHAKRTSFPVLPADAITVYAAQGATHRAVIGDMAKPPSMPSHIHWLACYVMLSRATSLEGLLVLRPATRAELTAGGPPWLLAELDRLERMERESHAELVQYLERLPEHVIPSEVWDLLREDAPHLEAVRVAEARAGQMSPTNPDSGATSVALAGDRRVKVRHSASPRREDVAEASLPPLSTGSLAKRRRLTKKTHTPASYRRSLQYGQLTVQSQHETAGAMSARSSDVPDLRLQPGRPRSTLAASAADQRAAVSKSAGIGDIGLAASMQAEAERQAKMGTSEVFGASRAWKLRRTLGESSGSAACSQGGPLAVPNKDDTGGAAARLEPASSCTARELDPIVFASGEEPRAEDAIPSWKLLCFRTLLCRQEPDQVDTTLLALPGADLADKAYRISRHSLLATIWNVETWEVTGLPNLGNTCFVNAVVQALLRLEPLYAMLKAHAQQRQPESCLLCKLYRQMTSLRSGAPGDLSEVALAVRDGQLGDAFAPTVDSPSPQCDAWELMAAIFDVLSKCEPRFHSDRTVLSEYVLNSLFRERSSCTVCETSYDCFRPRLAIDITVEHGESTRLLDLYERHCRQQRGQDQRCPAADTSGCRGEAYKQEFLEREPPVLLLRFLRFYQEPGTWAHRRHNAAIEIPEQIKFLRSGPYQFASAVLHHGDSARSGHYTAWRWDGTVEGRNSYR